MNTNRESDGASPPDWRRWLVHRTVVYKTTWKLRIGLLALFLILAASTRGWWVPALGWGLVSDSGPCKPDLILVDNLAPDYLAFEKAAELERIDGARMVLVLVTAAGRDSKRPDLVPGGVADVMIRAARLQSTEILPFREIEPLTLNTARQVAAFIKSRPDIHSVLVVTDGFRSKRTQLVYSRVLGKIGVAAYTYPVWGTERPDNWAATWHGRQDVLLQYLKLLYYELIVFLRIGPPVDLRPLIFDSLICELRSIFVIAF